jgi:minimal CRISPR polymerase-like protein
MYIVIDGDDSGRKIAACYINNDEVRLRHISQDLERAALDISNLLASFGFRIIFCAADGVAAVASESEVNWEVLFQKVQDVSPRGFTFSAGVGNSLHEAYVALLNAKSLGKDRLEHFGDIVR